MYTYTALISESQGVPNWEVQMVAAALQIQVSRDFTPLWGIDATISAFDRLEDVPTGYWPIIIRDDIGVNAAGIHLDHNKKPFGLVRSNNRWTLTASHELLEMLADPMGNRIRNARAIGDDSRLVNYLVEVCDPSEAEEFGYLISGVLVSDFYLPEYFLSYVSGNQRYSFTGAIEKPLTILPGGYISWHEPSTDQWWQQTWFSGPEPTMVNLGVLDDVTLSPRAWLDRKAIMSRAKPGCVYGADESLAILRQRTTIQSSINNVNQNESLRLTKEIEALQKAD